MAADGRIGAILFGGFMLVVGVFCIVATWCTRVWVDAPPRDMRTVRGYADPIHLDRLTSAVLSDWGLNRGRQLFLRDAVVPSSGSTRPTSASSDCGRRSDRSSARSTAPPTRPSSSACPSTADARYDRTIAVCAAALTARVSVSTS